MEEASGNSRANRLAEVDHAAQRAKLAVTELQLLRDRGGAGWEDAHVNVDEEIGEEEAAEDDSYHERTVTRWQMTQIVF